MLPLSAWEQRVRVLNLARRLGRWASVYYRVSAPILRKVDRLDPDALRHPPTVKDVRLLSIYTQLYRIEAGAWFANHKAWLSAVVDEGCVGGMPGMEAAMASWDVQSDVARAAFNKTPLVLAFLDYYKFFGSFEPRFFGKFLSAHGVAPDFVDLFVDLNVNSVRHIKIGNTFGPPIEPFNALGQGDPWVLMVAILYVSCQFRRIHKIAPQLKTSAVIDDRSIRGPPEDVQTVLLDIVDFDAGAGHTTNPDEITLSATTAKWAKRLDDWLIVVSSPLW